MTKDNAISLNIQNETNSLRSLGLGVALFL
jgi:hypothetical protein